MRYFLRFNNKRFKCEHLVSVLSSTVLPAKSDSDVMFVYKVILGLESIDYLCINPIRRIHK